MIAGGGRSWAAGFGLNAWKALWLAVLLLAGTPAWAQPGGGGAIDRYVPYGTDPAQRLDLYHPASSSPARLVVYVHGGGWTGGRKAGAWQIARPCWGQAMPWQASTTGFFRKPTPRARLRMPPPPLPPCCTTPSGSA